MNRAPIGPDHFRGVVAVPPFCRRPEAQRPPDFAQQSRLLEHIAKGGIRRFMFGGNAQIFHATLRDYAALAEYLAAAPEAWWMLPAAGPSFGRALEQAEILRPHHFPAVMLLPCGDPRDAAGLAAGWREISDAAESPLIVYLKDETNLGGQVEVGLDMLGQAVADGLCVGIKYAVVRADPAQDPYLEALLRRVPREKVMSGIGERPAVIHLRDWKLPGFTTGSGCLAPRWTSLLFEACVAGKWAEAEAIRERFLPFEDCRDAGNPAKVLHQAVELAGIARTGPLTPYLSPLPSQALERVRDACGPLLSS